MATVKKSKKKVIIPICIILVIAIAAGAIFGVAKSNDAKEVSLYTIATDDIVETVSLTGEVTAGTSREYKVGTVATVKEVFVNVGDKVKKGDLLATFDVTSLDNEIASLQVSYNEALNSYNSSVAAQKEAQNKAKALDGEIKSLEAQIAKLQVQVEAKTTAKAETTKAAAGSTTAAPQTTANSYAGSAAYAVTSPSDALDDLAASIQELNKKLDDITHNMAILTESIEIIAQTVAALAGELDIEELTLEIVNALIESGIAEDIAKQIVDSIDLESMVKAVVESDNTQLTAAQIQLIALEGQQALYNAQADDTIVKAEKTALNTTKKALDVLKAQKEEMSKGWKAAFDGTITAVDIDAGMQTTAISTGIKLENLDSVAVTVSLSEYDLQKVKVGMGAKVTTAFGTYDAEVASIAPTATGGSSGSILDSVGSMAGISGLSSLTDSGAGVECVISVPEADSNIVVGFDANVEIQTGEYTGVTVVPIESIKLEKTGSYVYLYNAEEGTVTKTQIETGATSDSVYEIKSGLSVGDQIIAAPESTYEEDTFKVKIAAKTK